MLNRALLGLLAALSLTLVGCASARNNSARNPSSPAR